MSTQRFVYTGSLAFFVGMFLLSCTFSQSKTDLERMGVSGDTPTSSLEGFLKSAYQGNEKGVNDVAYPTTAEWLSPCVDPLPTHGRAENQEFQLKREPHPVTQDRVQDLGEQDRIPAFRGENIPDDLRGFARYVSGSGITPERFKVVDSALYQDEALLHVTLANRIDPKKIDSIFAFAFVRVNGTWRVIGVIQTDVEQGTDLTINYGRPRPTCN